jgi:multidrug efflux pump subunit AcrB
MKSIISYFIKYPIAANLLMFLIFVFGIVGFTSLRSTFFPEMSSKTISIQAISAGLSPLEVEEAITKKIEYKLEAISGVEDISSSSMENISSIIVTMERGHNMYVGLQNVNNAIDQIKFGVEIDELFVQKIDFKMPTISFSVSSKEDLFYLKDQVDKIEDELKSVDGISEISITGLPEKEIEISVNETTLLRYNISIEEINNIILKNNINLSSGKIEVNNTQYLLRSNNKKNTSEGIGKIIIRSNQNGSPLYLKDIANIAEAWSEESTKCYINNNRSVKITVSNTETQDILFIADYINKYVSSLNNNHKIEAQVLFDASNPLKQRIELLSKNGIIGFCLVLLFLTMFLHPRISFWVALSIPISFLGMFFLAPFAPITVNMMTMYAMILVIGILVDDGIIIGENIIRKFESGLSRYDAAVEGTMEVFPAVFAGVSTTAVAFLSFFFFEGMMGEFGWQMGFVVITTLFFSLIEGAFILPAHIAYSKALDRKAKKNKISIYFNNIINNIKNLYYKPFLNICLSKSYLVYSSFIVIFIFFIFFSPAKFTFFPSIELDNIYVEFKTNPGTTIEQTKSYADQILKTINQVNKEIEDSLNTSVIKESQITLGPLSHTGDITMFLASPENRGIKAYDIVEKIRSRIKNTDGIKSLIMGVGDPFGKPLAFSLLSNNSTELEAASIMLTKELEKLRGVAAASSDYEYGPNEVNFILKNKAKSLGISNYDILYQVRQAMFGKQVQDLQTNKEELKLWIRYDEVSKNSFSTLEDIKITTTLGVFPLKELVSFNIDNKILSINRKNGKKIIEIEGELSDANSYSSNIISEVENNIFPKIKSNFKSVKLELSGSSDEGTVTANSMKKLVPVFALLILCIVMITFRSKAQTILVFILMPFTLVGVVFGHLIHGLPISVLSGFGVVALIGVLVNDALVFITSFNLLIKKGATFMDALRDTAMGRFRPIILTTITTVFGLLPLIFETSMQAQFLIPMAISLSYGIIMATLLTLILLPVMLLTVNNIRLYISKSQNRQEVEPAFKELKHNHE